MASFEAKGVEGEFIPSLIPHREQYGSMSVRKKEKKRKKKEKKRKKKEKRQNQNKQKKERKFECLIF